MSDARDEIADLAQRVGAELEETALEAFQTMLQSKLEPPATMRERLLIRVMALQLASSIATVMAAE